jgi:acetolactate decarboxylase
MNSETSCAEFQKHIYAHYAGDNALHHDQEKGRQIYQTSIMSALIQGTYEGEVTYKELAEHGDFGLGTFNELDGEMIAIDGQFYQLRSDDAASLVDPDQKTPFATVTFFRGDFTGVISHPLNMYEFKKVMNKLIQTENLFFAIRLDGIFESVKTRTESLQGKPFKPLKEVTHNQPTFELKKVRGTLAGFRSPDYSQGLSVAGYYLNFITDDRKSGGHVLDFVLNEATLKIDTYSSLFIALPETVAFETAKLEKADNAVKKAEG